MDNKNRVIAFYLPQFYPTKENNEWWQPGFTEWTNVGNAKVLFKGHYQPRVPADLGYYDLRVPEVRVQQAEMAKEAGIEGFCYWHYWFAGKRLLDIVFDDVVASGSPNFPFCLCWANHSWYQKTWDPNKPDKLLIEQTYPGVDDYINHFTAMLPAFKDKRYIKENGKLLFGVFAPLDIPDFDLFKNTWNRLAKENGLDGFSFFGFTQKKGTEVKILNTGYDSVVVDYVRDTYATAVNIGSSIYHKIIRKVLHKPFVIDYQQYVDGYMRFYKCSEKVHPCILPNFDHSPRSSYRGTILHDSTPEKWGNFCDRIKKVTANRVAESNFIFIKAWNEWGEGNYMEPDLRYGKKYIEMSGIYFK